MQTHAAVAKLLPIKGLSLVIGMISDTVFRNIVSERRIVTPENQSFIFKYNYKHKYKYRYKYCEQKENCNA